MKSHPLKVLLLLSLLALLIYSNTFSVPFIFDDTTNITDNAKIRDLSGFIDFSGNRYIGFLTFALNYHFGGLNVFGYHLVNLLIHIANGFLVYLLVLLLFRAGQFADRSSQFAVRDPRSAPAHRSLGEGGIHAPTIALLTALLFIVHPIQTQAVTYIVQRFASLVTLFYLLAVVCYLKWRLEIPPHPPLSKGGNQKLPPLAKGGWGGFLWYFASLAATVLAMKTKENSFTLPIMILAVEWIFFKPLPLKRWANLVPFLLMLLMIPFSQVDALGEAEGFARDTADISRLDYLFTQFRVIVTYLRLLLLPIHQNLDYDYPVYHSLFQPAVLVSFLFLAGLVAFAIRQISRIGRIRLIAFGIFWFFLTLSIESSIIPIKDVIFEHRLYLPSVGFFLGVSLMGAWVGQRCQKRKHLTVLFVLSVLCSLGGLSAATYRRNEVWKDKIILWRDVAAKTPGRPRGHYNLGLAYQEKGMFEEAISSYRMTIGLKPDYADAHNNLGNIYKEEGRLDEAVKEYEQAFTVEPDHAESRNNLGIIYTMRGALPEAIRLYQKALELKPDYADACNNLGIAYSDAGRLEEAVEIYRKGLSLENNLDRTHFNLGNVYVQQGKFKEAIGEYQAAVDLKPELADYHYALGNAYAAWSRLKEAALAYEAALSVKPDFAEAHNNLGNVHMIERHFEEAVREYRKALELKPDYADAARNLDYAMKQLQKVR